MEEMKINTDKSNNSDKGEQEGEIVRRLREKRLDDKERERKKDTNIFPLGTEFLLWKLSKTQITAQLQLLV